MVWEILVLIGSFSRAWSQSSIHSSTSVELQMCVSEGWSDAMEMVRFQSASIKHDFASRTICTAFSGAAKHCSTNFVPNNISSSWHCCTRLILETSSLEARVWKILQQLLSDVFGNNLPKNVSFHSKIITTMLGHFRPPQTERLLWERGSFEYSLSYLSLKPV